MPLVFSSGETQFHNFHICFMWQWVPNIITFKVFEDVVEHGYDGSDVTKVRGKNNINTNSAK